MPLSRSMTSLRHHLERLPTTLTPTPRALLVVSAHWEEELPTVMTSAMPPMLYDYSGFPPESYAVQWPAPGAPRFAEQVRTLLAENNVESRASDERGFDHGTFVVTKLMYPDANLPTFQLSLTRDLDAARLFELGRALAPLRSQGVLILGSGSSYHNLPAFGQALRGARGPIEDSARFHDWLAEAVLADPSTRHRRLVEWHEAPRARACHPREEHLLPLMVCAGAAAESAGAVSFRDRVMGVDMLAATFA